MSEAVEQWVGRTREAVAQTVFGVDAIAETIAMAYLAGGHVLLEGVPGLGKTLLARTLAGVFGGRFGRVQCTPDLMPSDVTGTSVLDAESGHFRFRPGPVFADLLLVDEINRTGPRTQAALLEAMEERAVTVDGERHALAEAFTVIATRNPVDFEGTYPLPESQIDRFLVSLVLSYPDASAEMRVLETYARTAPAAALPEVEAASGLLAAARAEVDAVTVEAPILAYVVDLAQATRGHEEIALGVSTRGARALLLMARVAACAAGEDFVGPDAVKRVAPAVLPHRLVLTPDAQLEGRRAEDLVEQLLASVPVPR